MKTVSKPRDYFFSIFVTLTLGIMKTLTLQLPDTVDEKAVKMQFAAILFQKGFLSSGQAADLAGISKREFIETVGQYGVSIFGESIEDLEKVING
jgi:predicted HTH domain antitoxin